MSDNMKEITVQGTEQHKCCGGKNHDKKEHGESCCGGKGHDKKLHGENCCSGKGHEHEDKHD